MTKENIPEYSVTELSTALKNTIEDKFGYVRIKGELSGINNHSSGHIYLTLKDENAVINGIIWRSSVAKIKIRPEEGLEVICTGKISTGYNPGRYAGRSNYQITIDTMKPAGVGALMAILEERKEKLKSEGLFEIHHKKSIPKYPSTIGVITSPTGAVLQDIKHRVSERFPCNIILWPVPVQGNDAAELIENAIRGFNKIDKTSKISKPEVLILARGGGSIEDLWCFNEERIVRAVFDSSIPLISAVGHETDTTLVDYVSDIRAPTPTAAAEIATPSKDILFTELNENENRLNYSVKNLVNIARERILNIQKLFPDHKELFNLKLNELNNLKQRLPSSLKIFIQKEISNFQNSGSKLNLNILKEKIRNNQNSLLGISNQFLNNNKNNFLSYSNRVNSASKLLESLSYKSVIKRGFAVIRNSSNKVIGKKTDIIRDNKLSIETKFGIIKAEIKDEQ
ncbi:exodeoxyribonuclease VII large subunit [Pelagibacterales bacterium]|jgi:exodeoxyribonuclease VII large subunit|nr:exodeoxyribonuclease VII large subunit [Pelagibacterales bacterium]MDB9818584.1 exodeoxyribonuclease VII large subunit [Pelagibacterales bacterium]|tara:strand:- start:2533 stop:3897 length:1365 start_codon:yes stop_codon:yes gene_type:complete